MSRHLSAASQTVQLEAPSMVEPLSSIQVSSVIVEQNVVEQNVASVAPTAGGSFWKVFASTFVTIFLAELGDKTQVSTLLMSAEFHAPWVVFAGAAAALVTTSLLGVCVGCWLARRLSPQTLDRSAGIMLAFISLWLLWDVLQ